MKNKIILLTALLLAALLLGGCSGVKDLINKNDPGTVAPAAANFTVEDKDGNFVSLSDNKGKPVIVNFWATWCPPCRSELVYFNSAFQKYGDDVVFMMVNMTDGVRDTRDGVRQFIAENGYTFPVYYDVTQSAAQAYDVSPIPMTLFIDADGNEFERRLGALNETLLEQYITALTGGDAK